jgi:gamma-glutamylcyclotransferase
MDGAAAERRRREVMLHFAYGSNMHRGVMRKHAPAAVPLGIARLPGYRFVITSDGYASIAPARPRSVYGMLWRLTLRDRVTLDLWENIAAGQYRAAMLPVLQDATRQRALVYVARRRPLGRPKSGYMEIVVDAARALELPPGYIACLEEWLPVRPSGLGSGYRKLGDLA